MDWFSDPEKYVESPEGFLRPSERKYLMGVKDVDGQTERNMRQRIRDSIHSTLIDFAVVAEHLEDRDRKRVFDNLIGEYDPLQVYLDDHLSKENDDDSPREDVLRKYAFTGVVDMMRFVYLGSAEAGFDWGKMYAAAIERAEEQYSGSSKPSLDELVERIESGDIDGSDVANVIKIIVSGKEDSVETIANVDVEVQNKIDRGEDLTKEETLVMICRHLHHGQEMGEISQEENELMNESVYDIASGILAELNSNVENDQ